MANQRSAISKQEVYKILEDRVLFLDIKPGDMISDKEIAEELKVSRTPVREAIQILQQNKLVNVYPQSGTFAALIDTTYIKEIIYIRHVLELDIFNTIIEKKLDIETKVGRYLVLQELAINENDPKEYVRNDHLFHREIFGTVGRDEAWTILENIYKHTIRYHILDFFESKKVFEMSLNEHKEILKNLKEKNRTKLMELLIEHHDCELRTEQRLREHYPDYFLEKII